MEVDTNSLGHSQPFSLTSLPNELLEFILEYLIPTDPSLNPAVCFEPGLDLYTHNTAVRRRIDDSWPNDQDSNQRTVALHGLCLSCRHMLVLARPLLYQNIILRSAPSMVLLLRTLLENASLTSAISHLSFAFSSATESEIRGAASTWQDYVQARIDLDGLSSRAVELLKFAGLDQSDEKSSSSLDAQLSQLKRIAGVLVSLTNDVETVLVRLPWARSIQSPALLELAYFCLHYKGPHNNHLYRYPNIKTLRLKQDYRDWKISPGPQYISLLAFPNLRRLELYVHEPINSIMPAHQNVPQVEELYIHCTPYQVFDAMRAIVPTFTQLRILHVNMYRDKLEPSQDDEYVRLATVATMPVLEDLDPMSLLQSLRLPLEWHAAVPDRFRNILLESTY
ncbi:hypothetical protein F4677DRAFT_235668 [Hypoxylon crocopeplum]|nr:hypothetical protein F4677DRAFT_235668 [Hypoxylon crocopeplum]